MEKSEITALFKQWNSALKTGDPKQVAALYAADAILLPTVSNQVRHNHAKLKITLYIFWLRVRREKSMNQMFESLVS